LYRQSILELDEVKNQINELLGVKRPSSPPCRSLIVLIPKKDGTWRMCGDYIALSKITIKNQYSLPKIDNLFDQLQHARFLTKLDLKSGLSPYSSEEGRCVEDCNQNQSTIVQMHCGTTQQLYKCIVVLFSLCNTTTTFMMVIAGILHPFIICFVMMYLNDIFVFNETWKYHLMHLRKIFKTMKTIQRTLNWKKC